MLDGRATDGAVAAFLAGSPPSCCSARASTATCSTACTRTCPTGSSCRASCSAPSTGCSPWAWSSSTARTGSSTSPRARSARSRRCWRPSSFSAFTTCPFYFAVLAGLVAAIVVERARRVRRSSAGSEGAAAHPHGRDDRRRPDPRRGRARIPACLNDRTRSSSTLRTPLVGRLRVRQAYLHRRPLHRPDRDAARPRRARAGSCVARATASPARAAAENTDRARLLGVRVKRVSLFVWAIAGLLSARHRDPARADHRVPARRASPASGC